MSRYSKIRSNRAKEDCTSVETCNIDPIGKNSRDCSVVKPTMIPALIVSGVLWFKIPATR